MHTIRLRAPLQGRDIAAIIDLACEINGTMPTRCVRYLEGNEFYQLGQHHDREIKRFLVIPRAQGSLFEHDVDYEKIIVTEHPTLWQKYVDHYDTGPTIAEGKAFVKAIEKALGSES
jgi:hypothetical protein